MGNQERVTVILEKLPEFDGIFTWDQAVLYARIRATKPDYDRKDPKTWPRMTDAKLEQALNERYDGKRYLPFGLAYDENIAEAFTDEHGNLEQIKMKRLSDGEQIWMSVLFYQFPFVYGRNGGHMRNNHLRAANRDFWMQHVLGKDPASKDLTKVLEPDKPKSSAEAFNEVLKMMNDNAPDNSTEVETLRKEAIGLKWKLRNQVEEHAELQVEHKKTTRLNQEQHAALQLKAEELDLAQESRTALETKCERLQVTARQMTHQRNRLQVAYEGAKRDKESAQQELRNCRTKRDEQLAEKDQQLETAKQAAADADERVMKIWAEMKKSKETEQRKRGAGDGAIGSEAKKAKLGP